MFRVETGLVPSPQCEGLLIVVLNVGARLASPARQQFVLKMSSRAKRERREREPRDPYPGELTPFPIAACKTSTHDRGGTRLQPGESARNKQPEPTLVGGTRCSVRPRLCDPPKRYNSQFIVMEA